MIDKIALNIVPLDPAIGDHSTRLYNRGNGFTDVAGQIYFGKDDSLYVLVTSDRTYTFAVSGDLVTTTEAKQNGVAALDFNWSDAAKARGNGKATITVTNPDAPDAVTKFEVSMAARVQVKVTFSKDTGANVRVVLKPGSDSGAVDREIQGLLNGSQPRVDSSAVRRALKSGSARPSGFIPQDVSDKWRGSDVGQLRRNILT